MRCACLPLESLLAPWMSLRRTEEAESLPEVPEVYRARYSALPAAQPLPPLLVLALSQASPGVPVRREQAFRRSRTNFPNHFLHSASQGQDALGEAVYYFEADGEGVVQRVFVFWPLGVLLEGPPNFCHGGCGASLLDDAFGAFTNTRLRSMGLSGQAVTAYLHVDYKAPTPLPGAAVCAATLDRVEGRKVFVRGELLVQKPDGTLQASMEANALFVELKEGFASMKK
ncbi:unnamed protein product [Polarella glacialis]|uniref:Acyl-coenzyme A thioesterase THEM4 n=1 Tax=Polarella glacialis TaxID=89957 RepID=A0A813DJ94_POLGL|nr:unnamed protein product [Polarella glacialis]